MIEFDDVSFSYRGAEGVGVSDIDLAVRPGACVLVCGPSGCGKTTLTRLANGLAPAFFPGQLEGTVRIDGRDAAELDSWEVAARVGSVFQNPRTQFFNVDSTGEVAFSLESQAWPEEQVRARTRETIDELDIAHLADRNIFTLSGGEKQRIAYASVWAARPNTLVLDEPTSNLDARAIADMRGYLLRAKKRGCAVLVAEHRLWWLMDVADEVVVMDAGRIVRRLSVKAFRALPAEEVRSLGLRTRDLGNVRAAKAGGRPAAKSGARPLVEARGVCAGYKERAVLSGVDLSLEAGDVVALVGANGAGKSTLSRVLMGLKKPSSGSLRIDGATGESAPKRLLATGSMVFQDVNYQLFAESVAREVAFGMKAGEAPTASDVATILAGLGLAGLEDRHPHTLSGGQKQRLAVAACVASGKRLLVFDEPTSGLDLASMEQVAALVRHLADEGRAVLVVTHDVEFIACACDRAVLLEGGAIAEEAPVEGDLAAVRALMERAARA